MGIYRVVFEYQDKNNGHSGLRSMSEFESEEAFQMSDIRRNPKMVVMARDISLEHALNYLALTPEIHHFTALIDDIFGSNSIPNYYQWEQVLRSTYDKILSNRKRRQENVLLKPASYPYRDNIVNIFADKKGKYLIYQKMLSKYVSVNEYGDITNLNMAFYHLAKEINAILFYKNMEWLIKAK
jgi:hypothetical protein